jgi:hypothetical protein
VAVEQPSFELAIGADMGREGSGPAEIARLPKGSSVRPPAESQILRGGAAMTRIGATQRLPLKAGGRPARRRRAIPRSTYVAAPRRGQAVPRRRTKERAPQPRRGVRVRPSLPSP